MKIHPSRIAQTERAGPEGDGDIDAVRRVDWANGFRMIDLFAGIGGMRLGMETVGGRVVFSSEWDVDAQKTYLANFGEQPAGDITQIDPVTIPDHDVLLAGFPCQPFSVIGDRKGFLDTRGTLFFNIEEILRAKRPPVILLENVKNFKSHDSGRTFRTVIGRLTDLGYFTHSAILNALDYGACQKRERTIIVGFRGQLPFEFPKPTDVRPSLGELLEPDDRIPKSLWASAQIQKNRLERLNEQGTVAYYPSMWHENKGGCIGLMPHSYALRANASYNYVLINGVRRPTGREMLRFQGFPDSFEIVVSHSAIRKQCGNSVAVPVIAAVAKSILAAVTASTTRSKSIRQLQLFE